jgi:hypothetical protein
MHAPMGTIEENQGHRVCHRISQDHLCARKCSHSFLTGDNRDNRIAKIRSLRLLCFLLSMSMASAPNSSIFIPISHFPLPTSQFHIEIELVEHGQSLIESRL